MICVLEFITGKKDDGTFLLDVPKLNEAIKNSSEGEVIYMPRRSYCLNATLNIGGHRVVFEKPEWWGVSHE